MQGNRSRDTAPELALRSALHARGWRFRVQHPVPGRVRRSIDIAFTRRGVAVLVDGCFWHGCAIHGSRPATNSAYWQEKVARNRSRDEDTDSVLTAAGWTVVRIWEHVPVIAAVELVETIIGERDAWLGPHRKGTHKRRQSK
ncbi:MAG: very short patch repair endonuclease [Actinomycetota bacterium]|nr:very short patch repair endonuclease [Actinomycetota bacterium]